MLTLWLTSNVVRIDYWLFLALCSIEWTANKSIHTWTLHLWRLHHQALQHNCIIHQSIAIWMLFVFGAHHAAGSYEMQIAFSHSIINCMLGILGNTMYICAVVQCILNVSIKRHQQFVAVLHLFTGSRRGHTDRKGRAQTLNFQFSCCSSFPHCTCSPCYWVVCPFLVALVFARKTIVRKMERNIEIIGLYAMYVNIMACLTVSLNATSFSAHKINENRSSWLVLLLLLFVSSFLVFCFCSSLIFVVVL